MKTPTRLDLTEVKSDMSCSLMEMKLLYRRRLEKLVGGIYLNSCTHRGCDLRSPNRKVCTNTYTCNLPHYLVIVNYLSFDDLSQNLCENF